MTRRFSIIKEDIVFSLEPRESGIRATQLNGLAKRGRAEKVVCLPHCWMAEPTVCVSFPPLTTLRMPTRRLLSFLYCIDSLVPKHPLSTACKNVCADLSKQRPAVASVPAGQWQPEDSFVFDNHCGQASCFENKYQTFDMTFIFHNISTLPLLE